MAGKEPTSSKGASGKEQKKVYQGAIKIGKEDSPHLAGGSIQGHQRQGAEGGVLGVVGTQNSPPMAGGVEG
eukprot:1156781-Pelagomonas_calceolata.AAC.5